MTYQYKHIPASMSIKPKSGDTSPKSIYTDLFHETVSEQFYNASNWYTIQEEIGLGSKIYSDIDVRIAHVINAETGLKLGDDWKTLMFPPNVNYVPELGRYYLYNNNTWLTVNTEMAETLSVTCTIRRCNNTLRWIDEDTGAYYEEPCLIDYLVKEPRDYFTQGSPFTTPGGFLHIYTQFNERTNLINENQRFLFGNSNHWTCYKVIGTGLNDFQNNITYNNSSAKLLVIDMIANFVNNELDDVVNGVADYYTNLYTVALNNTTFEGSPSDTIQLRESITYNKISTTRPMEWSTSNAQIATVDTNGLVTLISNGSCLITANIEDNASASAVCTITVSASPAFNNDIILSPDKNYVLEGSTNIYSAYLYVDDVIQPNTFTFTCNGSNVPSANYTFTQIDGNHFSIANTLRCDTSYLVINCASGSYTQSYNIDLRGAWLTWL